MKIPKISRHRIVPALRASAALFFLALACACAETDAVAVGDLRIERPWIRAVPPGAPAAGGFMTVRNAGATSDRLLSAQSDLAERVEVHEVSNEGGIMRTRPMAQGLPIPAGAEVALRPGGYHLMLVGPKHRFVEGQTVPVRLRFERAGDAVVLFPVEPMAASGHAH